MSLAGCQINPIDVNFHLQNSLEIFDKNSADKIGSKKDKVWKVSTTFADCTALTLIDMREGTFIPLYFLDWILSAEFLSKQSG